jgi:hypothetical protein
LLANVVCAVWQKKIRRSTVFARFSARRDRVYPLR